MQTDIEMRVIEDEPVEMEYIEGAIKPEQTVNITPTNEPQTVFPDEGMTIGRVNVEAIPPVSLQDKSVTPTKQAQTVTADDGYAGLDSVEVEAIPDEYIVPTGTKQINITQNGTTTHDVTEYADAEIIVNVNTDPEKGLVFGDYDADGYPTTARFVGTWTEIPNFFLYQYQCHSQHNNIFYKINSFNIPDSVNTIGEYAFAETRISGGVIFPDNNILLKKFAFYTSRIYSAIEFKRDVTFEGTGHFHSCNLTSVTFGGNVNAIQNETFKQNGSATVSLYDFSHCSAIPPLYSVSSINCKSGCVIRIPAALSDTTLGTGNGWESATNWSALTDIVWEVV